jgi:hypothetical protein
MGLGQAVTYLFEDRLWVNKLAIVLILSVVSLIPVLGLVALAALLGYMLEITANVKRRVPGSLPVWLNPDRKIAAGAILLAAFFLYNLPNALLFGCALTTPSLFGDNLLATGGASLLAFCCLTPMIFLYTLAAWSLLAAGIVRFAESRRPADLYRLNTLFGDVQRNGGATLQWIALATLLNIILALLTATVCGAVAALAFAIPLHGHLLGQYGQRVDFAPSMPPQNPVRPRSTR